MKQYIQQFGLHELYAFFACLIMLYTQVIQERQTVLQKELSLKDQLWFKHSLQYKMAKENVDVINTKYHDLKHYLSALRTVESTESRGKVIDSIEKSVMIYDSIKKLIRCESWIAFLLVFVIVANLIVNGPLNLLITLATGNGTISDESVVEATALTEVISEEGIVLLENENNLLPLENGSKINVFGWTSTNPCYGRTGSGALSDAYPTVSLLDGLSEAGFLLNTELSDFYTDYSATRPTVGIGTQDWTLPEPNVSAYSDSLLSNAKNYSDTAVVVISRVGGEGANLPTDMAGIVCGSYYGMSYDDTLNSGNAGTKEIHS